MNEVKESLVFLFILIFALFAFGCVAQSQPGKPTPSTFPSASLSVSPSTYPSPSASPSPMVLNLTLIETPTLQASGPELTVKLLVSSSVDVEALFKSHGIIANNLYI